ncbi:MAG: hypothetical protein Q3979_08380 [Actinomycetaceae bacterium]|nr:hypothetical protein [Actinomycetaceae bacterium]
MAVNQIPPSETYATLAQLNSDIRRFVPAMIVTIAGAVVHAVALYQPFSRFQFQIATTPNRRPLQAT